ncbi:Hypothetical predicted protein [Paramuricea clavata]|uniref:Uncharacterized protein n=1 Tax=Paramuricea clavata TaxID=317549 RepID=A0A7D9JML5_PARCT|nr:Hypothetical predicted protein [Paramuricea clavata]
MVAEVFGQAIRKCPEIQGVKVPRKVPGGTEVEISQYADDNTCIVTNSYGLVKVIDVFNEYGRVSGARLNTTKSKGLWLGDYGQIQGNIEEMGTTVSDVTRENDGDREIGGFDALACGKDIPANA